MVEREDLKKENINEDYNDVYWEERFTLLPDNLPSFIANFGEKILVTGKYLNVIRYVVSTNSTPYFFHPPKIPYKKKIFPPQKKHQDKSSTKIFYPPNC